MGRPRVCNRRGSLGSFAKTASLGRRQAVLGGAVRATHPWVPHAPARWHSLRLIGGGNRSSGRPRPSSSSARHRRGRARVEKGGGHRRSPGPQRGCAPPASRQQHGSPASAPHAGSALRSPPRPATSVCPHSLPLTWFRISASRAQSARPCPLASVPGTGPLPAVWASCPAPGRSPPVHCPWPPWSAQWRAASPPPSLPAEATFPLSRAIPTDVECLSFLPS